MKIRVLSFLSVLGMFLFGALAAHAETVLARAKIPFDFAVGNKILPAGDYEVVKLDMAPQEILVRSEDGPLAVFSSSIGAEPKTNTRTMFVFSRYGSSYFLENIWLGPAENGLQLPKSKYERELMAMGMTESRIEVAELGR